MTRAEEYDRTRAISELRVLLQDYLQKLERDDYDPNAADKMRKAARLLDLLERWEAQ